MQVLSFLCTLFERKGIWGPHLIVMPLSVISSWQADIQKYFSSMISVYVHHGEKKMRQEKLKVWKDDVMCMNRATKGGKSSNRSYQKICIVVTSYDMAIKDHSLFLQFDKEKKSSNMMPLTWQYVVVRECSFCGNYFDVDLISPNMLPIH